MALLRLPWWLELLGSLRVAVGEKQGTEGYEGKGLMQYKRANECPVCRSLGAR